MNELKKFITEHQFPEDLSRIMRCYAKNTWASQGIKHQVLLQDFPEDIYSKIHLHLFRQILDRPLFKRGDARVKKDLALHVSVSTHRHGDVFIHKGEVVQALHMVSSGALQLPNGDLLGPGALFGTWQMRKSPVSRDTLQVVGGCTVHSLSLEALQRVLDLFPQWGMEFFRDLQQDLDHDICPETMDNFFDCHTDSVASG
uniref:Cyclic nucleotide-binding domain-containing protein n=1 Tax=Knipowitschia caucasica TaxID=637954 RepID=A0AAV2JU25_KNICA